jgi:hypothetical protein
MPTRLLDLGEHGLRHNPRLIVSDENFGGPHDNDGFRVDKNSHGYVTLSNCWGTSSVLKLLQINELLFRNLVLSINCLSHLGMRLRSPDGLVCAIYG